MADGSKNRNVIEGSGTAKIPVQDIKGNKLNVTLKNALYVPSFNKNIISISLAIKDGYKVCGGIVNYGSKPIVSTLERTFLPILTSRRWVLHTN